MRVRETSVKCRQRSVWTMFGTVFLCVLFCLAFKPVFADTVVSDNEAALQARKQAAEEARAKAQKEAEARAERLRQDAEEAQRESESLVSEDTLWDDAFYQYKAEFGNIVIQVDQLYANLKNVLTPLQNSLSGIEESARRLFALSASHKDNPMMLEAISQRGLLLQSNLQQLLLPVEEMQGIAADLGLSLEQIITNFSRETTSPEIKRQGEKKLKDVEKKLTSVTSKLAKGMEPALVLQQKLVKMHTDIEQYLPSLWGTYYFSSPMRFFEPGVWKGIGESWEKTMQNWSLRQSVDSPRTVASWQEMGLRFMNVFVCGIVLLAFARKAIKGKLEARAVRHILFAGLSWVFVGLALIAAAYGSKGEVYRGILMLGSLLVIWGEMALAWDMRCLTLKRALSVTPLWPIFLSVVLGTLISYPDLPMPILSVAWVVVNLVLNFITYQRNKRLPLDMPQLTVKLLHAFYVVLWLSLGIVVVGWARLGILFMIVCDCIIISIQLTVGLMQVVNRISSTNEEQKATHSLISGIVAAFAAPIVLALVLFGIFLWVPSWPGGEVLVWHYLGAGFSVGSATFSLVHVLFILSLFYFTRALTRTAQNFLNKLSVRSSNMDKTLIPPLQTAITYGLWILFVLMSLHLLGFGLEKLALIAGGLSVGIGFGMQTIVNNFLSGLILIFSRTLHEGDIIEVGGQQGVVRKISIRATMVETFDSAMIFVPNSEFVSTRLVNWTRNGRGVRRDLAVGVAYGTDPQLVKQFLLQVAHDTPDVFRNPSPKVLFMNFGASSLDFILRFWSDIGNAVDVSSHMRAEIARIFAEHNIEIAFPQLDVHLVSGAGVAEGLEESGKFALNEPKEQDAIADQKSGQ